MLVKKVAGSPQSRRFAQKSFAALIKVIRLPPRYADFATIKLSGKIESDLAWRKSEC